jgi:hypothetical protein
MIVSMATELTVKERAFAQLIIEGTKTAAYRKVYSDRGSAATQAVNAYKFSKKPKVKAEVARLLRQREFPADDYARIRDVIVAGLTETFLQEADPRLRVKVGSILLAYADAGLKLHPVPTEKERKYDELTRLLADVVHKQQLAGGREQEQPIVEMEQTDAMSMHAEPGNEASEGEDLELAEPIASDNTTNMDAYSKNPKLGGEFKLVPIPGHFPPRYRRVRRLG